MEVPQDPYGSPKHCEDRLSRCCPQRCSASGAEPFTGLNLSLQMPVPKTPWWKKTLFQARCDSSNKPANLPLLGDSVWTECYPTFITLCNTSETLQDSFWNWWKTCCSREEYWSLGWKLQASQVCLGSWICKWELGISRSPLQHIGATWELQTPSAWWLFASPTSNQAQIQGNLACISVGIYSFWWNNVCLFSVNQCFLMKKTFCQRIPSKLYPWVSSDA